MPAYKQKEHLPEMQTVILKHLVSALHHHKAAAHPALARIGIKTQVLSD